MITAKTIKARRKLLRISQRELGKRAGISGAYVSQIESGSRVGKVSVLDAISKALGITDDGAPPDVSHTVDRTGKLSPESADGVTAIRFEHDVAAWAVRAGDVMIPGEGPPRMGVWVREGEPGPVLRMLSGGALYSPDPNGDAVLLSDRWSLVATLSQLRRDLSA